MFRDLFSIAPMLKSSTATMLNRSKSYSSPKVSCSTKIHPAVGKAAVSRLPFVACMHCHRAEQSCPILWLCVINTLYCMYRATLKETRTINKVKKAQRHRVRLPKSACITANSGKVSASTQFNCCHEDSQLTGCADTQARCEFRQLKSAILGHSRHSVTSLLQSVECCKQNTLRRNGGRYVAKPECNDSL